MQNHLNQLTIKHLKFIPVLVSTLAIAGGAIHVAQASSQRGHSSEASTHIIVAQKSSTVAFTGTFVKAEAPTSGTARIVANGKHRFLEIDSAFKTTNQAPEALLGNV